MSLSGNFAPLFCCPNGMDYAQFACRASKGLGRRADRHRTLPRKRGEKMDVAWARAETANPAALPKEKLVKEARTYAPMGAPPFILRRYRAKIIEADASFVAAALPLALLPLLALLDHHAVRSELAGNQSCFAINFWTLSEVCFLFGTGR